MSREETLRKDTLPLSRVQDAKAGRDYPAAAMSSPMRFPPNVVAKPARAIAPPRESPLHGSAGRSNSAAGTAAKVAASPIPCCREDASTPSSGARNATQTRTPIARSSPTIAQVT